MAVTRRPPLHREKTAGLANKQPLRWNVVMFDSARDDWLTAPDRIVARNLSEDEAFAMMIRLERRNPRMGYSGVAVKHRH